MDEWAGTVLLGGGMMPLAVPNSFGMLHNDTQNALTANAADYITLQ